LGGCRDDLAGFGFQPGSPRQCIRSIVVHVELHKYFSFLYSWVLGSEVLGSKVQGSEVQTFCRMPDTGCRIPDAGYRMPDAGCRIPDNGCLLGSNFYQIVLVVVVLEIEKRTAAVLIRNYLITQLKPQQAFMNRYVQKF
jgi:hypothetical protein